MKNSARSNRRRGLLLVLCALLMAAFTGACSPEYKNPYEYSLDKWAKTPTNLILYAKSQTISLAALMPDGATAVAVDSSNSVFAAGASKICVFDADGKPTGSFPVSNAVRCLAVDKDGLIYAGMNDRVEVLSMDGELKAAWASAGPKAYLTSVALGSNDVFVADFGNKTVWRYNKAGELAGRTGKPGRQEGEVRFILPSPYFDAAVAPDGELWISNPGEQTVCNFSYDGTMKSFWGKASMDPDGFAGCCNPSHFAIGPDGRFVTSEKGLPRVKVYSADGLFEGFVAGAEQFDPDTVGMDLAVDSNGRVIVLYPKRNEIRIYVRKHQG